MVTKPHSSTAAGTPLVWQTVGITMMQALFADQVRDRCALISTATGHLGGGGH